MSYEYMRASPDLANCGRLPKSARSPAISRQWLKSSWMPWEPQAQ